MRGVVLHCALVLPKEKQEVEWREQSVEWNWGEVNRMHVRYFHHFQLAEQVEFVGSVVLAELVELVVQVEQVELVGH